MVAAAVWLRWRAPQESQLFEPAGFFRQHDGDAVADRIGELGGARNQFLLLGIIFERALGERADQNFEELTVDGAGGAVGRRCVHGPPGWVMPLERNGI